MQDYSISKCTKRCSVSGRGLEPGEKYVSVIVPDGESVVRRDIASSEWNGPQEEVIGWWECQMPAAAARKLRPAPNGVLLDTLSELVELPGKETLAYLLGLLLMRRRVLCEQEVDEESFAQPQEAVVEPQGTWCLVCPADGRQWNIPLLDPSPAELISIQDQLNELLFTEE